MSGMAGGPDPTVRLAWLMAFAAVAIFYLAKTTRVGVFRHTPHLLMALGMVYMLLPAAWQVLPLGAWLTVFGVASAGCVVRTVRWWHRHHDLDLEFAHSELTGCVAMMVMLPLLSAASMVVALPLAIGLGTYFLAYALLWAWRAGGRPDVVMGLRVVRSPRAEALVQMTMGAGMAFMFLLM